MLAFPRALRTGSGLCLVLLVGVSACGHSAPKTGRLTVTYQADLCGRDNRCVFLPAAGATIQLFKDGAIWRRVTANEAGRISLEVPPGNYWARATLPALHWQSPRSAAVEINRGGGADITGALLPRRVS